MFFYSEFTRPLGRPPPPTFKNCWLCVKVRVSFQVKSLTCAAAGCRRQSSTKKRFRIGALTSIQTWRVYVQRQCHAAPRKTCQNMVLTDLVARCMASGCLFLAVVGSFQNTVGSLCAVDFPYVRGWGDFGDLKLFLYAFRVFSALHKQQPQWQSSPRAIHCLQERRIKFLQCNTSVPLLASNYF